ncbi:MAG: hypothetical protein A2381_10610 [Bdellovibrionales bacterium RIFOXYB1_FULL_37_110]|nr:MAG: hypothetical protein A2181_06750 [Bdellovibrionales bacterium RIFOXYA1_FULL_38_20]OFZ51116.1 MAG: hypothetical protein A2417_17590 [Bdellovibrionales bacterium RIFOXYC1_FULL_37_79]OFZ54414.1 MAG: hypothetical protein A2328_08860 [Bdellovibrionales bacterium RIFOXYB2_FULL_36_6]OFZ61223.1 MAG: hypothetical protein A2381_10610 [Bdellovibrionales bacterium RIFOXYB1_FULL_37_110]OFZ61650.1 MAG: hypothetical protein A2577_10705 [Bdellovibrionales bacterium RIFOXYD1_FULL_36_51]
MNISDHFIISNLKKNPEVRLKVIHLIEESFNYTNRNQFKIDFYPLIAPSNAINNHILIEKSSGDVVAHIGVLPRFLKNKDMLIPIILMGAMVVQKNKRGQGLFRLFLESIIKSYEPNCALMLLWSNLTGLYNKFNFYEAGIIYQTGNNDFDHQLLSKIYDRTSFSKLNDAQFNSIKKLYDQMSDHDLSLIHRSDNDWESIKKITSTDLYLLTEDDIINGYFCVHKGHDLENIIHEIVFISENKESLIETLRSYKLWLTPNLSKPSKEATPFYTAFFRPGNQNRFNDFLNNWSNHEIEVVQIMDNLISYKHLNEPLMDTTDLFLKKIFGPDPFFKGYPYGPLIYISGLDSI